MIMTINNINVNYEVYGQGNPLLILHGWGGCINSMLPIINEYKNRYKIIALDFPGHGESSIVENWNVTKYMELLYQFINNLDLKDISIIAHSFGGRVSILLSSTYPDLVKKLILVDSSGIIPKRSIKYYIRLYSYKIGKHCMRLVIHNKDNYNKWLEEQRTKRGSKDFKSLVPQMRVTFINVVKQNLRPYLRKIKCPTLLIWGEFDDETPVYMGRIMEKEIKNSKLIILENCGHFSYLDDFLNFKKEVNEFLN